MSIKQWIKKPLVSIIIPTYNREKYIKRAINSVLSQSFQDFEIIIIDDGSTDNTKKILEPYLKDKRIKYIFQKNQKVSRARNNGIKNSTGKYVALLDSDDYWIDNNKLKKQIDFLEKKQDYVLTSGGIIRINEKGQEISKIKNPEKDEYIRKSMLLSCLITPSAVVFKREAYDIIDGFNEKSDLSEDWQLFLEMGKIGKLYNFQEYFLAYLQGDQNRSNFNRRKNLKYNLNLLKKYKKTYPNFKKAYLIHFCYYIYSFIPFNKKILPFFSKIKRLIFGKPAYIIEEKKQN